MVLLEDNLDDDRYFIYLQWYTKTLDIIESNIFKPTIFKAKSKAPANICKIYLLSKSVELVNTPYIFHGLSVTACLPTFFRFDNPTLV